VELVVVIGIIVVLLALGAAFLPGLQGNQKVQTGVDRLAQWLLIAKNRAKHDGRPTGLSFVIDADTPTADPTPSGGYLTASQFFYVQQPDDLVGDAGGSSCFTLPPPPLRTLLFTGNPDFTGGDAGNPLVQPGDYVELFGGGGLLQVGWTGTVTLPGPPAQTYTTLTYNPRYTADLGISVPSPTTSWRIFRQPRRVPGEDFLTLPQGVVVDLSAMPPFQPPQGPAQTYTRSLNVPRRDVTTPTNPTVYYEILFSPAGDVIGQVVSGGKILLWVRDATVPSPVQGDNPPMQGNPALVAISVRGGFLGTYPVLPNTDPTQYPNQFYTAARQGRSGF
jgi:hypothetical protein